MRFPDSLYRTVGDQPYPLVFASVTGSHQYGFPSDDSDYDIRGMHVIPVGEYIGINKLKEVVEKTTTVDGIELDLVTFDVKKFVLLVLAGNGNVLEQVFSPHTLFAEPPYAAELQALAKGSLSRRSADHYLGFADQQLKLFDRSHKIKQLLYIFRTLCTGRFLMNYGAINADLAELALIYKLDRARELIAWKMCGAEHMTADFSNASPVYNEVLQLRTRLEEARDRSALPLSCGDSVLKQANDFVVRVRTNLTWRIGN